MDEQKLRTDIQTIINAEKADSGDVINSLVATIGAQNEVDKEYLGYLKEINAILEKINNKQDGLKDRTRLAEIRAKLNKQ